MADGADDDQEKTLPATERRLEQAREEGQVPRSRSLATALVVTTAVLAMWMAGPAGTVTFGNILTRGLTFDFDTAHETGALGARLMELTLQAAIVVVPICLVLVIAGALAYLAVGGVLFSPKGLEPKWEKLDPIKGVMNLFSVRNLAETGKTLLEVILVLVVAGLFVWTHLEDFKNVLAGTSPIGQTGRLVMLALLTIVGALVIAAIVDVPLQIWKHGHGLRMSMEEMKRESRESDGDPQLKGKIKSAQRDMAKKRMMQEVPRADVVVTNPTRYAVALKYEDGSDSAPRVLAKGTDLVAARIRELATEAKVPLVEAPPLARALFAKVEIGEVVPQTLFTAVAQVLAFVYRLKQEAAEIAAEAYVMNELEVPPELDPLTAKLAARAGADA